MTYKRTAHIISHTHWDREWYLPYEKHHVLLVKLVDTLLHTLETDPDFKSFYLDGQTIILEDYLQVRPDNRERLERYIKEGRIVIGPWYILQDAFLTSSEANIRNLQIGHQDASRYGTIAKVGYFPDTFGNIGQAPQMMRQAGIDNAVFGRGVKPTGFNNTVADSEYESSFSELIWEGPDGSRVLGILFANWYSNGNEVPADEASAKEYWERKLADAEKYAATGQLLFMNGCDHQPIQRDLPEALEMARKLYPDTEFVHSNFEDYLASVNESMTRELSVVKGELRSQRTDGWSTLVNTASARVYLKQMNQLGQAMLERVAEPLAAFAYSLGHEYPHHLFTYAWKTLMQNHPHDSICGCSVDEVHREMVTRFDKSRHVAEAIIDESKQIVADAVDTSVFEQYGEAAIPFVVYNTTGWNRSGVVSIELDIERIYFRDGHSLDTMNQMMYAVDVTGRELVDHNGSAVAHTMADLGLHFGYELPDDKFRQPYMARRVRLTFEAKDVAALGLAAYGYVRKAAATAAEQASASLAAGPNALENEWLRVDISNDGSFQLTDKRNGQIYSDLGVYENTGDIGNEYMYKQPNGEQALTTKGLPARIRLVEDTPYRASFEIIHEWAIPASAEPYFEVEKQEAVYFPDRKSQRTETMVPLVIRTEIALSREGKGLEWKSSFNNQAKDHRVRVLFPTDLAAAYHHADSIFEVVRRDNEPAPEWSNPSNAQHQQAFVDVSHGQAGLTVANLGLNEYEVLRDGRQSIAVTLLRAVAELGDWGVFPTPEAQCLGEQQFSLIILPHNGDGAASGAYAGAYQFQAPWTVSQTGVHSGKLAPAGALFQWEGSSMAFTSLKVSEQSGDYMARWFNMNASAAELKLSGAAYATLEEAYKSDVLEQAGESLSVQAEGGAQSYVQLPVGPCEIVTIAVKH
ncbi:alpha-mannosidase [Paenibacillus radicis (ex Gao et al. 2016)]|uniref:Glycosyl hydrolase n=1 Tax=Paenibacillus radicis (ex Gao et al. 2016) TaxID=1737354 RepID=A0A917H0T7_9BACL|nr:alpha-mannosidase [Paenibacillus radicis (ex Gao et al. 2016)]GGG64302.1 glycosyl hydrolase [Paenibacillus radicis (ex Gao et al. 2016)]